MEPDFKNSHYLLDGATGTRLFAKGMPYGVCPEEWILEHPDIMEDISRSYVEAGCDVLYTPTFGANAGRLEKYGLAENIRDMNKRLVDIARRAAGEKVLLAGNMSTAGVMCEPFSDFTFTDLVGIYADEAFILKENGVDYLALETFSSVLDMRAAIMGARQAGLPLTVTMTSDEHARTYLGSSALSGLVVATAMSGVSAFGMNCCDSPKKLLPVVESMMPLTSSPFIVKANAGMPEGEPPKYTITPEQYCEDVKKLLEAGASIAGGCCGTDERHISALRSLMDGFDWTRPLPQKEDGIILANDSSVFFLEEDFELSEEIECGVDMCDDLLDAEDEAVDALCVRIRSFDDAYHFGMNAHMAHLPISFLADGEEELENALFYYSGKAMIDSRSDVDERRLEELSKAYGAIVV